MFGLRLFIKSRFPMGCVECDCRHVLFAPYISLTLCFISGEASRDCVVLTWLHVTLWGNGPIYSCVIAMNFKVVLSFIYLFIYSRTGLSCAVLSFFQSFGLAFNSTVFLKAPLVRFLQSCGGGSVFG